MSQQALYTVLGRFARRIGHDIRNPLSMVTHAVYLLKMQLAEGDPAAEETAEMINTAVSEAERILDSLRDYVCTAPPERSPFNVMEILEPALLQATFPDGVSYTLQNEQDLPIMMLDGDQLVVALRIMLEYCAHAAPEHSKVAITLTTDDMLNIEMAHTGKPLAESDITKMLDPFASEAVYRLGLELPLARLLIEGLDGTLSTDSGQRWCVRLPVIVASI